MTTEVDDVQNTDERDVLHEIEIEFSQTPESELARYHQNKLMRRIALSINDLFDADTAPFIARECQRHFWNGLNLQEPNNDRFHGSPKPEYSEDKIYWNCAPEDWPIDKQPFEPRIPIAEMNETLARFVFVEPDQTNVVDRNLQMLKKLLKLQSTEVKFLTAAWCASRWNVHDELGALPTALRMCRFGYVKPEEETHRRITLLSTLLDTPYESTQSMVGYIRSMVCLGFLNEDAWHGEAANVFELLHLEDNFLKLLETPHENVDDLERGILALDGSASWNEMLVEKFTIEDIIRNLSGELRTAYLAAAFGEKLDAVSIREILNRISDLNFDTAQVKALEGRITYPAITQSAISTALKCRRRSCHLLQFELLRTLYLNADGLDSHQVQPDSSA